jgi:hypothetical protein
MTNESPGLPDDESRRIQAEIDRIRSGLRWLRAGQMKRGDDGEEPAGETSESPDDLRSLAERMQSIVDRARAHAEHFERMMRQAPETRIATFVEVQEMLAATLAKRRSRPEQAKPVAGSARKRSAARKKGGGRKPL